jgi:hypothetical protein
VLAGPPVSVPRHAAPLPLTPFRTPPLATLPCCRRSRLLAAHVESLTLRGPLLSHGNGAARPRRPGADAGRPSCPPLLPGPLSPPHFPLDAVPNPGPPCPPPCSSSPVPPGRHKKPPAVDLAPLSPHFSSPSAPCAAASQLPTKPVRAIPWSSHRLATRSPSHPGVESPPP